MKKAPVRKDISQGIINLIAGGRLLFQRPFAEPIIGRTGERIKMDENRS